MRNREHQPRRAVQEVPVEGQQVSSPTPWKEPPSWLPSALHSLAYRDFLLLVVGQISNSLSIWMDLVARSVLVIAITGSAVQLGLITVARGLPTIALAPLAGLLADRVDRRLLMLISKILSLVANAVFAAIIVTGNLELWHVYVTAIVRSLAMSFDGPARQALLPALVPPRLLINAVGINTGSLQMTRIISASVAGALIAFWAVVFGFGERDARAFGGVYLVIAVASAIAVIATYLLRVPSGGRVGRTEDSWFTSFAQGARFVWRTPLVLGALILIAVQSAFGVPYLQVFVPWIAIEVMGLGAGGAGLMIAVSGVGALAGAVAIAGKGHLLHHRGKIAIAGLTVYGVALAMLGLTSTLPLVTLGGLTVPLLPLAMIFLVGIGQVAVQSIRQVLLLEVTPNELLGRVMSFQSLDRGFTLMGGAAGGFTIALIGGPYGLALFGALCAAGAVTVGVLNRGLRNQD